jgi:hypothetical protein
MKHINRYLLVMLVFVSLLVSACGAQTVAPTKTPPSILEPIEGTDLSKVTLTEKAAERIGVETVTASGSEVPYAAVIYDIEGNTWIYTSPAPLTFVREQIVIDHIEGDTAFLAESLPGELNVVTMGVIEIYGTETGVSK